MESTPFKLRFYLKYTIHESHAAVKLCAKQPIIIPEIWLDKPRKFGIIEANQAKFLKIKKYYKKQAFHPSVDTAIVKATLLNDAGIYGAAKLAL